MNDRYRLGGLGDDQLLAALTMLVKREHDSLSDLLAHLAEIDQRELCVALGYSSLFGYCTDALGFCKSSAGRRIAAARVCRDYPEAFTRVANGELQLSVLCALRPHLSAESATDLFAACSRKSYEQVESLLAARFPRPDVGRSARGDEARARSLARRVVEAAVRRGQEAAARSVAKGGGSVGFEAHSSCRSGCGACGVRPRWWLLNVLR